MQWFMYKTCYRIDWGAAYQVAVHACLANQPRGEEGGGLSAKHTHFYCKLV